MSVNSSKQVDYSVLDSIEAVRVNTGMFIGDTETPNHLATEVIDNMLDEVANSFATRGDIFIDSEDGSFWVSDNGRGLKLDKVKDPDTNEMKDGIELLCTKLFSGSKFRLKNEVDYNIQIGMHGVGLVVVNALSDWLVVQVRNQNNKNQIYEYQFIESKLHNKIIREAQADDNFSTRIGFKPSKSFFDSIGFDTKMIVSRLLLTRCVFDNCLFTVNDREIPKIKFEEYVRSALGLSKDIKLFEINKKINKYEKLRMFLTYVPKNDNLCIGDVNLRTCDGTYLTNTQTIIKNIFKSSIDKKFKSLDEKEFLTGLRLYVSLTLEKPKFDAQIKSRMKTDIKKHLQLIETELTRILNNDYIMKTLILNLSDKITNKMTNEKSSKRVSNHNKLRDCVRSPGDVLYIVEGDSADGTVLKVRKKETEAIFPLRGKMLNVEKGSVIRIQNNQEVTYLREALGNESYRRYKKVRLLMDADSDGLHIAVMVTLFLYKFASDIIENGNASVVIMPLYGATKKNKFVPIYQQSLVAQYEKTGYNITRFKGLGEMNANQMEVVLRNGLEYIIQCPDSKDAQALINNVVLNSDVRKALLLKENIKFERIHNLATAIAN